MSENFKKAKTGKWFSIWIIAGLFIQLSGGARYSFGNSPIGSSELWLIYIPCCCLILTEPVWVWIQIRKMALAIASFFRQINRRASWY